MCCPIDLDYSKVVELLKRSSVKNVLLLLTAALEQEQGREPKAAIEVLAVAADSRLDLQEFRESLDADL